MVEYFEWLFDGGPESVHRPRTTAPLPIEVHGLTGLPVHSAHAGQPDHTFMDRGIEKLGPVGYSILRSALFRGFGFQAARTATLARRIHRSSQRMDATRPSLHARDLAEERDRRGLLVWELIETLGQAVEQLAALTTAARAFQAGADLGTELLAYKGPAWSDVQATAFADLTWWNEALDLLPGNRARDRLGPEDMFCLLMINRDARFRVEQAVTELRHLYDERLHRVAQRYKHAFPLLHVGYGLLWDAPEPAQRERVGVLTSRGALVTLDQSPSRDRAQRQYVVPVAAEDIDVILTVIEQARWLTVSLASALVQRAEHPTGGVVVLDPLGKTQIPFEQWARTLAIYSGVDGFVDDMRVQRNLYLEREALRSALRHGSRRYPSKRRWRR